MVEGEDHVIIYWPKFREFGVPVNDGGSSIAVISHCPWCGAPLPRSLRPDWFERLDDLGLEPEDPGVPMEMNSDQWWLNSAELSAGTPTDHDAGHENEMLTGSEPAERYDEAIEEFAGVVLEDSLALKIESTENRVVFGCELALAAEHSRYVKPASGWTCWVSARIIIESNEALRWIRIQADPTVDPDGSADLGSFDTWFIKRGVSHIVGDWGALEAVGARVSINWMDDVSN